EQGSIIQVQKDVNVTDIFQNSPPSIARIGKYGELDRVRIAYPALNSDTKRQVYKVANVAFGGSTNPAIELVATVHAEDPKNVSCVGATFIADDLVDSKDANKDNATLFYWIEAPSKDSSQNDKVAARYQLFYAIKG